VFLYMVDFGMAASLNESEDARDKKTSLKTVSGLDVPLREHNTIAHSNTSNTAVQSDQL
jgi:hypothetical protein